MLICAWLPGRCRYVTMPIATQRASSASWSSSMNASVRSSDAVTPPEVWQQIERANPIGRLIEPAEIAELVVWLCSDQAALVNGTLVAADTGWHVA